MPSVVAKSSYQRTLIDGDGDKSGDGSGKTHLYLNIYDISPVNKYLYYLGLGIFHSGIEAHGMEYGFGAHEFSMSGVFEVEPKSCPGFIFRRSVWLGTTNMSRSEFRLFIEDISEKYYGDTYHLMDKNCNHFTDEVSTLLIGKPSPGWVNRLAKIAVFFLKTSGSKQPESYHLVHLLPMGRTYSICHAYKDWLKRQMANV